MTPNSINSINSMTKTSSNRLKGEKSSNYTKKKRIETWRQFDHPDSYRERNSMTKKASSNKMIKRFIIELHEKKRINRWRPIRLIRSIRWQKLHQIGWKGKNHLITRKKNELKHDANSIIPIAIGSEIRWQNTPPNPPQGGGLKSTN